MKVPILPSRFENFPSSYSKDSLEILKAFIFRVDSPIKHLKKMFRTMQASNSGSFLVLKGVSGIGKTTFLKTLPLYIDNLQVNSIYNKTSLIDELDKLKGSKTPRIIILENRETFETLSANQLEKEIHKINAFIRSDEGRNTIIVWPCNGEDMATEIIQFAGHIGGSSLFRDDTVLEYFGPSKDKYSSILKNTFEFFNKYDLSDLGFSEDDIEKILYNSKDDYTLGGFFERIRKNIIENIDIIEDFKEAQEIANLIILVIATNNPIDDVRYLTKGNYGEVDFDRLLSSTNANIVRTINNKKTIVSMTSKEMKCKIVNIPYQDVIEILSMKVENIEEGTTKSEINKFNKFIEEDCKLKITSTKKQVDLVMKSNLTKAIKGDCLNKSYSRNKTTEKEDIFSYILELTKDNDALVNRKLCEVLKDQKLINVARVEEPIKSYHEVRSDILCSIPGTYIRVEVMWRKNVTTAEIADYTLKKIYNYCKAMGFIN